MDFVAHAWGVKRQPGEDDEHLMARIRRAAVNVPKMYRPSEPPEDWNPLPGFRIGDTIP